MKVIHKYVLALKDRQELDVPRRPEFMTAQMQAGKIVVWALVDTDEPTDKQVIHIFGTGNAMPDPMPFVNFLGTVQIGPMVWHVFQELK